LVMGPIRGKNQGKKQDLRTKVDKEKLEFVVQFAAQHDAHDPQL
jgi:hypothetical protein